MSLGLQLNGSFSPKFTCCALAHFTSRLGDVLLLLANESNRRQEEKSATDKAAMGENFFLLCLLVFYKKKFVVEMGNEERNVILKFWDSSHPRRPSEAFAALRYSAL